SDGKANLHQGAVGVGLDIATGRPLNAVQNGLQVERHPDTGRMLAELQIPDWEVLLELAARCYEVTGLGYLGTDMVLDRRYGPMRLELNAGPGLPIQVANGTGLLPRLQKIDALGPDDIPLPAADRVRRTRAWFAADPAALFIWFLRMLIRLIVTAGRFFFPCLYGAIMRRFYRLLWQPPDSLLKGAVMHSPRIGFIGMGLMGVPMSLRLLQAGFPLTVWNRNPAKTATV